MGSTDRIKEYIHYKGITKYKFCLDLGFSNKFLDNSNNMGTNKACKILHYYPDINAHWLLTGEGKMLREYPTEDIIGSNHTTITKKTAQNKKIPLYDLESVSSLKELFILDPNNAINLIDVPNIPKCHGAITIIGDTMYPVLKSGDIICYKEIAIENIFFGEIYLLSIRLSKTEEYITLKYIHKSDKGDDFLKLANENPNYEPNDIPISKITAVAIVKGSIRSLSF